MALKKIAAIKSGHYISNNSKKKGKGETRKNA
jgi:hypothetical protein